MMNDVTSRNLAASGHLLSGQTTADSDVLSIYRHPTTQDACGDMTRDFSQAIFPDYMTRCQSMTKSACHITLLDLAGLGTHTSRCHED